MRRVPPLTLLRTLFALGLRSIVRVLVYRAGIRFAFNPVRRLRADTPQGAFFSPVVADNVGCGRNPVSDWQQTARLFGFVSVAVGDEPPEWLANPLSGQCVPEPGRPWWQIPDFDPRVGDIKLIWELSRMDWVLAFAQRALCGDRRAIHRLNGWLSSWCETNPPYRGPNWKCGQEASIRVMHLAMGALILGQVRLATPALRDLIALHLRRIAPTLSYALGQDNNHGTSEAAALFIGGSWLESLGVAEAAAWAARGRHWLEERCRRLVGTAGTFSQYSLNYHRVMLDTLSMTEIWRRQLGLPALTEGLCQRMQAAANWLHAMVDPVSGDGPNLGANDGARLLQLSDTPYRDYRPSVQLAMALFAQRRAYQAVGPYDQGLIWLGVSLAMQAAAPPASRVADDGGIAVLRRGKAMAVLRYPRFRFRPSHADALHLDLWLAEDNLLRDGGTCSYNMDTSWLNYFSGTASHNTVHFDCRDQMPRLGRFLFGDWLRTTQVEWLQELDDVTSFAAGYRDARGAFHLRRIELSDAVLRVTDEVRGFSSKAVLRWRLAPGSWKLDGQRVSDGRRTLTVRASMPIVRCELVDGWESRHYLERTVLPVLEVEVGEAGVLTTDCEWPG
ncbi:heparinase II/III-family protein [Accumulibacter sp.]|uniref:heparinase II/III family protein n=1 Tax=Accumulibacter sp. TaxID=2053492 RepID=UPI0025E12C72|nr:heparinase II/III-family protein [Accumulibacter sp.]MCM8594243.1 heparinase II/III-family protein [Accumulibacter sp.]MCM8625809.1 heparinase II/III-family protein [Accumulibacter sp.]MDS4048387.1 heparinase II/III-family protein [Accumulibacter sp.]